MSRPSIRPSYDRREGGAVKSDGLLENEEAIAYGSLRGQDLNLRPRGYEPRELPDCSTPRIAARARLERW